MLICTVKPVAVLVVPPIAGFRAAPKEVAVTGAVPPTYPPLVAVIVAVELVTGATLVTVTKPVLLIDTCPDAVTVPLQK